MIDIHEIAKTEAEKTPEPVQTVSDIDSSHDQTASLPESNTTSENDEGMKQELEVWKARCAALAAERELAITLTGQPLLPGVAGQLIQLLKSQIVASYEEKTGFEVKTTDGRNVGDAIREWLDKPEYQHFRQAMTKGGTANRSETAATDRLNARNLPGQSLNEFIINQWRQRSGSGIHSRPWSQ